MKVTDYLSRLEAFATGGGFADHIKREVARSCLKEVEACFRTETDPYGMRWAPRKKDVPWAILFKSGALYGSFVALPTPTGVRFQSTKVYAARQNYGGGGITARNMLPSASRGLPSSWINAINNAFFGYAHTALRAA